MHISGWMIFVEMILVTLRRERRLAVTDLREDEVEPVSNDDVRDGTDDEGESGGESYRVWGTMKTCESRMTSFSSRLSILENLGLNWVPPAEYCGYLDRSLR